MVGNETTLRGEQDGRRADPSIIKRVKREITLPVTTGETGRSGRGSTIPKLASAVDFIAAHILPYWEEFTDKQAVDQAIDLYNKLRASIPASAS